MLFGVVGDGDPIERPVLFEVHSVVDDDLPAGVDCEQVVGGQRDAEHPRVEGVAGVDVCDALRTRVGPV